MKLAPTYKVDLNGSIRMHVVEVEGNKYRTESGLIDGARVISEWIECFGKNVGKSNGTTDEEQAFAPEKKEGWVNLYNLSEGPYLGSVYSSKEVAEAMSKKCGLQHYIATIKIEWEE